MRGFFCFMQFVVKIHNKIAIFCVMSSKSMLKFVYQRQHLGLKHAVLMLKVLNSCPMSRKIPTFVSGFSNPTSCKRRILNNLIYI